MVTNATDKKEILKRVILANVMYLINKMDLKVGKVEEAIGVSTGYLSRLGSEGNSTKIGLDLVSSLSTVLNVPMDLLCHVDLTALTETENSAVMFIGKLTDGTISGSEVWGKITSVDLAGLTVFSDGTTANPLIKGRGKEMWYASRFARNTGTKICGEMYTLGIGGGNFVYLVRVQYMDWDAHDYEMYICREGYDEDMDPLWESHPVCATNSKQPTVLDGALKKLYSTVAESTQHVQFTRVVKNAIDNYLNPPPPKPRQPKPEKEPVEVDELPF